jgi:hypothetical protein
MKRAWEHPAMWLAFVVVFVALAGFHFWLAIQTTPRFALPSRPIPQGVVIQMQVIGTDIDRPIKEFVAEFNSYLDSQNISSSRGNFAAFGGYLLAALTAALSFFRELKSRRRLDDPAP